MPTHENSNQGYYRFPTIHGDSIVFTAEDDLWSVSVTGGIARRLTSGISHAVYPTFSPDGKWLAFSGKDEGPQEIYVMPAEGGEVKRLTFLGVDSQVVSWDPSGKILFYSEAKSPFPRRGEIFSVSLQGEAPTKINIGPASDISIDKKGRVVIQRGYSRSREPAHWKRYRGGTAGDLWVDSEGKGDYRRLIQLKGNLCRPMWLGERIFFLSDHEGHANVYSCTPKGEDSKRHTKHQDFYARNASTDGRKITYHLGGDLFVLDPEKGTTTQVAIDFRSPRLQRARKFVDAATYLESYEPSPKGNSVVVTVRGVVCAVDAWDGPVKNIGNFFKGRHRLSVWFDDGKRIATVNDASGEDGICVMNTDDPASHQFLDGKGIGRPLDLKISPKGTHLVLENHRQELILYNLETNEKKVLDKAPYYSFGLSPQWSPDGRWISYGYPLGPSLSVIKLYDTEKNQSRAITRPVGMDGRPNFDPEGKFIAFVSARIFNPVYDKLQFELGFPRGMKPYLVTLKKNTPSPFLPTPRKSESPKGESKEKKEKEPVKVEVDFEGIEDRVLAFPVPEGIYSEIIPVEGKVFYLSHPVEGSLGSDLYPSSIPSAKAKIDVFDFESQKPETFVDNVTSFSVSSDRKTLLYRSGNRLRALDVAKKPEASLDKEPPSKKSGWIDMSRIQVEVTPWAEWSQMYHEAWRLQRDHFWTESMSGIDWNKVLERYRPMLQRVGSRGELSDLILEMQGELGTSHAYEMGGDYRKFPRYTVGKLGCDFVYDGNSKSYRVERMVKGDLWEEKAGSPLLRAGVEISEGDLIEAIDGQSVGPETSPEKLLVNKANAFVSLRVRAKNESTSRSVVVKTLDSEQMARYRDWVENNRDYVHTRTSKKVGYLHIPNMMAWGFSEFHRYFTSECERDGLVVDLRYNGGGHVSQLLLEKLSRHRIAYQTARWTRPEPYPIGSINGPVVGLTNEFAGSDGDIFSHSFKLMKIGPLIGKRTWGGVIGINPTNSLVDGGLTTQPEFSFWFKDVRWDVENYGTDPDIEIENRPQDYAKGKDPQLDGAIDECMKRMKDFPRLELVSEPMPNLRAPELPA